MGGEIGFRGVCRECGSRDFHLRFLPSGSDTYLPRCKECGCIGDPVNDDKRAKRNPATE